MSEAPLYVSEHMCASLMSRMSEEPLYDANACRTPTERLDLLNRNLVDCTLEPQPYQQTPDPKPQPFDPQRSEIVNAKHNQSTNKP